MPLSFRCEAAGDLQGEKKKKGRRKGKKKKKKKEGKKEGKTKLPDAAALANPSASRKRLCPSRGGKRREEKKKKRGEQHLVLGKERDFLKGQSGHFG